MGVNRRGMLHASLGAVGLTALGNPVAAHTQRAAGRASQSQSQASTSYQRPRRIDRDPRILLVHSTQQAGSQQVMNRLEGEDGDFATLRERGWKIARTLDSHIQLLDAYQAQSILPVDRNFDWPWAACLSNGGFIRSAQDKSGQPLTSAMFYWLLTGEEKQLPPQDESESVIVSVDHYPVHDSYWTVQGDSRPIIEVLLEHLKSIRHVGRIPRDWRLEQWSYQELRSLHDDLHRWGRPAERNVPGSS